MLIIKQSSELWDDSYPLKDLERAGRVCYQSDSKITDSSAEKFCSKIINLNHNSVLEFATIHLRLRTSTEVKSIECSKYLLVNYCLDEGYYIITGSVRAFREFIQANYESIVSAQLLDCLYYNFQELFYDLDFGSMPGCFEVITPKEIPDAIKKRHIHQTVSFITNRAVSHELVRHRVGAILQESQRYCRYKSEVTFIEPDAFEMHDLSMYRWRCICEKSEDTYLALLSDGLSPQAARIVLPNSCKTQIIMRNSLSQWEHIFALRTPKAADPSMRQLMLSLAEKFKLKYPGMFSDLYAIAIG